MEEEFKPRNYQLELMEIALCKNTIIFLPTGSGKTFIALLVLKRMSADLMTSYSAGGKISIILVNTIALVDQHAKYILDHTTLSVGRYSGEMNLDFWPKTLWEQEFNKHNVIIMTSQILVNLVNSQHIDMNKVNLLIFDECHRGVNDHSMRQLMKAFQNLNNPPRVLGLTATLLNGNCSPGKVMTEVEALETTYHSKVATAKELEHVVGFSTNPKELMQFFESYSCSHAEIAVINILDMLINTLSVIVPATTKLPAPPNLVPLNPEENLGDLIRLVQDLIIHIRMLGTYGGYISCLVQLLKIERIRKHCVEVEFSQVLAYVLTVFGHVKQKLLTHLQQFSAEDKIYKNSSDQVLSLLNIFKEYKTKSDEELCAIVFTQRRVTAKVLYNVLTEVAQLEPKLDHLKVNFMVGYNNNPYNDTRESLFISKKNRQVLDSFCKKEINVLVASNVLEEGVDIPKCTLVVKFDKPEDYRSYIQSKGRARHQKSLYYIMINQVDHQKYLKKYSLFQTVEDTLNDFLIGKNEEREDPSRHSILQMYHESSIPPYYVNGPNSANVNMTSAIPLLCQYCNSLPGDIYTSYTPEWYKEDYDYKTRVIIKLPTISPIRHNIEGPLMVNLKLAKRAAAMKACELLHKCGELDDHLLPKQHIITPDDVKFLFEHYPTIAEKQAGTSKMKRIHEKQIPQCLRAKIEANTPVYLHVINLQPEFSKNESNINFATLFDMYTSSLCFGLISANPLPNICDFPIFLSMGAMDVSVKMNQKILSLTENQLANIKEFHFLIFNDILEIIKQFLVYDNSGESNMLLLVPIQKDSLDISFDIVTEYKTIKCGSLEPSLEEKLALNVTPETYLHKIVSPWYRESNYYVVTEVCMNKTPFSEFPNKDYSTFVDYYKEKHQINIFNKTQPLLLVKGLSKRLNMTKPRGLEQRKRKDKMYEELEEYLVPEMLVKQEFPAPLWLQSSFLPVILSRICYLLQLEQLRVQIARETKIGVEKVAICKPLELDEHLLKYEHKPKEKPVSKLVLAGIDECDATVLSSITIQKLHQDFTSKIIESEYPWKDIEEPKDAERMLDLTAMDIEYYETFISTKLNQRDRLFKNLSYVKGLPALTYNKDFVPRPIVLLGKQLDNEAGPELRDIYRALTTAKANDIVNLERLETLGDSMLKLLSTLYIQARFPKFNEGESTTLKGRLVSNKNLYYLSLQKNICGFLKYNDLDAKNEWVPPSYTVPRFISNKIFNKEISINALFELNIPIEEQITGELSVGTRKEMCEVEYPIDENEESSYNSMSQFLKAQYVGDKHVADTVEALIGAYFESCGLDGAVKFVEWMGIVPASERLAKLLRTPPPNPILDPHLTAENVKVLIPQWQQIEAILGYNFKNPAYLLQALTHASYTPNRITLSYEKLEFLGDAILDFLITCCIYEKCGYLTPGDLTDLRSALVNNNTFASLLVRCGFHKFMLLVNHKLQEKIDKFAEFLAGRDYRIDDEVLILLEEIDIHIAEYIDVPKALGDVFEALAGAIYLDSNNNLETVWAVFYKIMWKEIDLFSQNVPKNVIRRVFEYPGTHPKFSAAVEIRNITMVALEFLLNGRVLRVHGFGSNKSLAKKAACKIALKLLDTKTVQC